MTTRGLVATWAAVALVASTSIGACGEGDVGNASRANQDAGPAATLDEWLDAAMSGQTDQACALLTERSAEALSNACEGNVPLLKRTRTLIEGPEVEGRRALALVRFSGSVPTQTIMIGLVVEEGNWHVDYMGRALPAPGFGGDWHGRKRVEQRIQQFFTARLRGENARACALLDPKSPELRDGIAGCVQRLASNSDPRRIHIGEVVLAGDMGYATVRELQNGRATIELVVRRVDGKWLIDTSALGFA